MSVGENHRGEQGWLSQASEALSAALSRHPPAQLSQDFEMTARWASCHELSANPVQLSNCLSGLPNQERGFHLIPTFPEHGVCLNQGYGDWCPVMRVLRPREIAVLTELSASVTPALAGKPMMLDHDFCVLRPGPHTLTAFLRPPKVPRHAGFPRGEHRGSRHRFL